MRREQSSVEGNGGSSPTLVMIHGWCCDRSFWEEQLARSDWPWRLVAVDLPNRGVSSAISRMADEVIAAADGPVVLVGHSMGGAVAVEAAGRLGERCAMLIGVDTFTDANFYARRPRPEIEARKDMFRRDFAGAMRGMVEAIVLAGRERGLVARIADAMAAVNPDAALEALDALLDWDIREHWGRVKAPAATINSRALAAATGALSVPGLEIIEMDGVGHFPMMEAPDRFNELVRGLLERSGF